MTHPLEDYLAASGETVEAVAARAGVEAGRLRGAIAGEGALEPADARRVVAACGGGVEFESLTGGLADLPRRSDAIDVVRLAAILQGALRDLGLSRADAAEAAPLAAEAVAGAYEALSAVTTRRGADRLLQVLGPVLAEILKERPDLSPPPAAVDREARKAAQRYCSPPPGT